MLERLVKEYPTPVPDAIECASGCWRSSQGGISSASATGSTRSSRPTRPRAARTDRTRYLASKAQLALAAPVRDEFRSVKLVAPLKQSLVAKKKSLDAAVLAYKQVAEYQVAETTTAATYETAELYRTLGTI